MKKLIGAFCDCVNMPKKRHYLGDTQEQIKVNNTQTLQMKKGKILLTGRVKKYDSIAWKTCMVEKIDRQWEKKFVSLKRQATAMARA